MSTKEQAWHIQHAARVAVRAAENRPWRYPEFSMDHYSRQDEFFWDGNEFLEIAEDRRIDRLSRKSLRYS